MPATVTVCPSADLTIYHALEHQDALLAALADCGALDLDLAQVEAIDSAGLQLLLLLAREAQRAGKSLRLVAPSPAVADAIALCNLADRFVVAES